MTISAVLMVSLGGTGLDGSGAQAQELNTTGCVGGRHSFVCINDWERANDPFVRHVPHRDDPAARARAIARDRRWVDRCRPVTRPDRYGVARYYYAMPGCEFGVGED